MSRYTRGRQIDRARSMNDLINKGQLTPDGADWLTLRMDPYHDFQRPIAGYPDADSYDTVVSVRNYETTVTQPTALGANWDMHVFTLPITGSITDLGTCTNGQYVQTNEPYNMGLVNIAKDAAGGPLFPTAVPVASGNFSMAYVDAFAGVEEGLSRVIGLGIEVIDMTAEMYKQGGLVAYKMPVDTASRSSVGYLNTAGAMQTQTYPRIIQAPPSTVNEAILYKGSVSWDAKQGCYMTVGQEGISNPFTSSVRDHFLITSDTDMGGADASLHTQVTALTAVQAQPLMTATTASFPTKAVNVTQSGIMVTGLDQNASIKVRVRVYVERAPQFGDSDLIPLASPSAAYDYKAIALYSKLVTELPVAVPVSFNAKGDWWRWIVRTVAKLAPVLGPVFGPTGGAIGGVIGNVAGAISTAADTAAAKRKRRNQGKLPLPIKAK